MSYVKVYKYKKQISLDNGVTWQDVTPAEYVPSGDPIGYYDTYNECMAQYRTIQSGTTCTGTHGVDKHNLDVYEVSYDNGTTWEVVSTSAGTLIEANSEDCGYSARTVSTGTTCVGVDKYQLIENQESYDYGVTWITISSSTGSLIETNSYDCGYRTRQTSGTPYCTGYDKYVDVSNQVSTDYGSTWTTISTAATMVEHNSEDCGYVPPFDGKYKLTSNDSSIVTAACDATSAVTSGDVYSYRFKMVSAEIGNCARSIGGRTFSGCTALSSVTMSDSVTSIGSSAFYNCSKLTGITIPSGLTTINSNTFNRCGSITSISIPNAVTTIGEYAFFGCSGLTSISIPNNVVTIGNNAFENCYRLTSCTLGSGVISIGNYAFRNCSGLTSVNIPSGVTSIGNYAFANCFNITSANIPSGVTTIGNYVFNTCKNLADITIHDNITSIGSYAFEWCSGLTSVNIPSSVTTIYDFAFAGCSGLTSITIGSGITNIYWGAFIDCPNVQSITCLATTPPTLGRAPGWDDTDYLSLIHI